MSNTLKIAIWNANGLSNHVHEIKNFNIEHKLDILLISETHFTNRSYIKINNYTVYDTKHPDGTAHGGSAIIIRNSIKHHELQEYNKEYLQATSVSVNDWNGPITITALYCPPKHTVSKMQYVEFYKTLGKRFLAGGDYNAKHTHWGSRVTNHKGMQLLLAINECKLGVKSTGQPTYWPTDRRKVPDLIDFCVTKGIADNYLVAESCYDLSSDHSPVIITVSTKIIERQITPSLYNKNTNWNRYRSIIDDTISLNIRLKDKNDITNAIVIFNQAIHLAAREATPEQRIRTTQTDCPTLIKEKIEEKRKLRKRWQQTRSPADKKKLNKAVKETKILLNKVKNESIRNYLQNLTNTSETDYSLWKATKKLKRPQQHIPPIKKKQWKLGK